MDKKKRVISIIIALVLAAGLIIVLLNVIPFKTEVDKEIDGMFFEMCRGEETAAPTHIRVKGTYSDYIINWFQEDKFTGGVVFCDNPGIPDEVINESYCRPYIEGNNFRAFIDYFVDDEIISYCTSGFFDKDKSVFMIKMDDYCAVFPATDKEEAKQSLTELECYVYWDLDSN